MSKQSVFCIVNSRDQVDYIVSRLALAGFTSNDISVLLPDLSGTHDFAYEKGTKAPEGAVAGASTGAVLGVSLGWLAGIGALVIPGIGPFFAAGPIATALSGAAVMGAPDGVTGALAGFGVPEYEAKRYEGKIKEGRILISVHTNDAEEVGLAQDVLEEADAQDIAIVGEASVSRAFAPSVDSEEP